MELFKIVPAIFMAFYLISQLLRFSYNSIKRMDNLSRRHFYNVLGQTAFKEVNMSVQSFHLPHKYVKV